MRIRTMAAFAAGVMVAAVGTAFATTKVAAIVGPDNQINGCYLTSAGLLRVVAAGTACREGESAIAWSATGAGSQGPVGPAGPKGDPGARWRGAWVSGTAYNAGDLVRRGGSVWIRSGNFCLIGNTNCSNTVPPPTNPTWMRFAQDGATGPRGPEGPKGDRGDPGISGYEIVTRTGTLPGFGYGYAHAPCPGNKRAIGGGLRSIPHEAVISAPGRKGQYGSTVIADGSGWYAGAYNGNSGNETITVYAICASVS